MSTSPGTLAQLERELSAARMGSRVVQGVVMLIAGVVTAYGTGNAHLALHHHDTPDPWGWLLYPAIELALIVALQVGAYLARYKTEGDVQAKSFDWGRSMRMVTGVVAVVLNVWSPLENHDNGGALLHFLGPFSQIFIIEALAEFRLKYAQIIASLSDQIGEIAQRAAEREQKAASRTRTQNPGVPEAVPPIAHSAYPGIGRGVPVGASGSGSLTYPSGAGKTFRGAESAPFAGAAADPETLKVWARKVDEEWLAAFGRPASIRTLKDALGIGQDKAVQLQNWLAQTRTDAATSGDDSDSDTPQPLEDPE